ncbi:MAG: transposase, partial [Planctomycetes bacterium]|nr:transposase [Planctomycetota bacterium]
MSPARDERQRFRKTNCRRWAWRRRSIDLVTTLRDPEAYPAAALSELYRERWLAELALRSLKVTLGMDVLRCKSVDMVRKELAMHQIAHNLIRLLMWTAGERHAGDPQRLSFAGTQQRVLAVL